jgi:uncharacterized membrane protein YraQ (UPF0718 family)
VSALILGGLLRLVQALLHGAPTLLIGVLVAGVLRHLVGADGTRRLFGENSWRSLPQAWALGMLLPVCSLGVIPIAREMRRAGVSGGSIIAFALTAPLFNPLSLLYGLTLATPLVVVFFALCSLLLVTILGIGWNLCFGKQTIDAVPTTAVAPGIHRMAAVGVVAARYLSGSTLLYCYIALLGNVLLCAMFPAGSLQSQFAHDDVWAPLIMLALSVPLYATPMTVMSQIGSMFVHGNSVGAAYTLLAVGTGINLGLLAWIARTYSLRGMLTLLLVFATSVTVLAYAMERPLYTAGDVDHPHTHAFDIYASPFAADSPHLVAEFRRQLHESLDPADLASLSAVVAFALIGLMLRVFSSYESVENFLAQRSAAPAQQASVLNWYIPGPVLGGIVLTGLVIASIAGCYVYYPAPAETLEEMQFVRAEALSAASSRNATVAVRMIERYDELTRKLQVGHYLRHGTVDDYQRMKCKVLRGLLEELKDEVEAGHFDQVRELSHRIYKAHQRCRKVFLELE